MVGDYLYCATHKKCLLPEDVASHRTSDCKFLEKQFQSSVRPKVRTQWVAQHIADGLGIKIYNLPKIRKSPPINTVPPNGVLVDTQIPTINLD